MFLFRDLTLNDNKEIRASLHIIFGVNWYKSNVLLSKMGIGYPFFLQNINSYYFSILSFLLKGFIVSEVRIRRRINISISKWVDNGSYIGMRHSSTLPVHGQRTRSNANTQRSKRIRILFKSPDKLKKKLVNYGKGKNKKNKKNKK